MIKFAIGYIAAPRLATAVFAGMGAAMLLGYLLLAGLAFVALVVLAVIGLLLTLRPAVRYLRWRMNPVRRTRARPAGFYQWR